MKSRPIIFSGDMVRAILDGRKIQTRRTRGLEDVNKNPDIWEFTKMGILGYMAKKSAQGKFGAYFKTDKMEPRTTNICPVSCRYGQVGDQLWVRENFYVQPEIWQQHHNEQPIHYVADTPQKQVEDYVKKSCRFMPRWALRITLEITGIRAERLVDGISREDCTKEGAKGSYTVFRFAWNRLNAKRGYGWIKNPWVWVIEFKEIKP